MRRTICHALLTLIVILHLAMPTKALAQEDDGAPKKSTDKEFVEIDMVSVSKEAATVDGVQKNAWKITVKGKAPPLPEGSVVDFEVHYGVNVLDRFQTTITKTKKISAVHPLRELDGCVQGLYLRWVVSYELQPPAVRDEMAKQKEIFWLESSPWNDSVMDKAFDIGDEKDLAAQRGQTKKYFSDKLTLLYELEKKLLEKKKAVLAKSAFMDKDQKLESKSWQSWVEREIRDPVRKLQGDIETSKKTLRFASVVRDLNYLRDIANGVAQLSVSASRELYRASKLEPDIKDLSPENLNTDTPNKVSEKFFVTRFAQICMSQEIVNPRTGKLETGEEE